MKFLFSLLLFLSAFRISSAQTVLKAGTYRHLVANQLVLDTGDFVLVDVEIRSSEKDSRILLDARKARSLRLEHSRLYGSGQQTGLAASGKLSLGHSRFENLKTAVHWQGNQAREIEVFRNVFESNDVAIALENPDSLRPVQVSFSLKCNAFRGRSDGRGTGLQIGKGLIPGYVSTGIFLQGYLGGSGQDYYGQHDYPNGNLWPGSGLPGFTAIENRSHIPIRYAAFDREPTGLVKGEVDWHTAFSPRRWRLALESVTDTCVYAAQQPKGQRNPRVCEQLVDEQTFLLPTHYKPLKNLKVPDDSLSVHWKELEMDPDQQKATLRVFVPRRNRGVHVQYLSASGEVLQTNLLAGIGWLEVQMDLSGLEPGTYQYRLYTAGKELVLNGFKVRVEG